jgi:hypothetical protein
MKLRGAKKGEICAATAEAKPAMERSGMAGLAGVEAAQIRRAGGEQQQFHGAVTATLQPADEQAAGHQSVIDLILS